MDTLKINRLLDKYYSGEILPEEYESLLSFLKEARDLTPELEAERRMLIAIDASEPAMPDNFEVRLHTVIDRKANRSRMLKKIALYSSAAAVLLICLAVGIRFSHQVTLQPESIAEAVDTPQLIYIIQNTEPEKVKALSFMDGVPQTLATTQTNLARKTIDTSETKVDSQKEGSLERKRRVSNRVKQSVSEELTNEEVEETAKMIDAALIDALSGLGGKQNTVMESIDNIKINKITL